MQNTQKRHNDMPVLQSTSLLAVLGCSQVCFVWQAPQQYSQGADNETLKVLKAAETGSSVLSPSDWGKKTVVNSPVLV